MRHILWRRPQISDPSSAVASQGSSRQSITSAEESVMEKLKSLKQCGEVVLRPIDIQLFATDLTSREFFEKCIKGVPLSEEGEDPLSQVSSKGKYATHNHKLPLKIVFTTGCSNHGLVKCQFAQLFQLLIGTLDVTLQVGDQT